MNNGRNLIKFTICLSISSLILGVPFQIRSFYWKVSHGYCMMHLQLHTMLQMSKSRRTDGNTCIIWKRPLKILSLELRTQSNKITISSLLATNKAYCPASSHAITSRNKTTIEPNRSRLCNNDFSFFAINNVKIDKIKIHSLIFEGEVDFIII